MIRQIKNLFSASSLRTHLSGSIEFIGLTKHFHRTLPQIFIFLFLFLLIFLSFNCSTNEPPPDAGAITLSVEDASCIEAWINLKAENITLPAAVTLKQSENNGEEKVRQVINLTTADTLLYVDSLLPKRSYKFKAEWINNSGKIKTAEAAVVTMDTTSHNFTWQEFTIGDWQSYLTDVWGTDENNVWACGTVKINDTTWGILKWNGVEWQPVSRRGGYSAIFGFSDSDIWVVGNVIRHFTGTDWNEVIDTVISNNIPYTSLWGTSSSNMYFGNQWGKIIHWDGKKAKVVYSGTVGMLSMVGSSDKFIIAVGTTFVPPSISLYYDGTNWVNYPYIDTNYSISAVTIFNNHSLYWAGDGIFESKNGKFRKLFNTGYMMGTINSFDKKSRIVATGVYDAVFIFNGIRWKNFNGQFTKDGSSIRGIYQTNNTIFLVGNNDYQAKIVVLKN